MFTRAIIHICKSPQGVNRVASAHMPQHINRIIPIKPANEGVVVPCLHVAKAKGFIELVACVAYIVDFTFDAAATKLVKRRCRKCCLLALSLM